MDLFECPLCGPAPPRDDRSAFCPDCGQPLFVALPPRPGRRRIYEDKDLAIERFADFLPLERIDRGLSLGEGTTPLLALRTFGTRRGIPWIFAKDEARNPTGSFKDRGTIVAIMNAIARGVKRIGTVSTGNMAVSTAAYGARGGLETFVLVKEGTPDSTLRRAAAFGARLIEVQGDYGGLFQKSLELGQALGISFMNSVDPHRMEGYKLTAFEIFLQLGRRAPGCLIVPVSSGGHLLGLMRGFVDLEREGLLDRYPHIVGVQARGCSPLAHAFETGRETPERPIEVRTIAHAISNPSPPAGRAVLRWVRDRKGRLLAVSDEEMLEAQGELAAQEGISCQPESAATWAAAKRLLMAEPEGRPEGPWVLVITGDGHAALRVRERAPLDVRRLSLEELGSGLADMIAGPGHGQDRSQRPR